MIRVLFIEAFEKKKIGTNFDVNDFEQFGHMFGQKLWNSRSDVNSKKLTLKSPQTIEEYYNSFSKFLISFFYGIIDELDQKKLMVCNWQRKRNKNSPKITTSKGQ